jgi:GTPases
MEAVDRVIKELDAYGKQTLIVFNKIDNLANREVVDSYLKRFPVAWRFPRAPEKE